MNKFLRIGWIGLGVTLFIALGLHLLNLPYAGTMPAFLVWATLLLIGITQKPKRK